MKIKTIAILLLFSFITTGARAQIGEHRSIFSVGVNGGYALSNIGFTPSVSQGMHGGMTGGISMRYICEKYFSTICSIYAEVNYAQLGWKENIKDANDQPVINAYTNAAENYKRTLNYIQIPIFAHLAWGKEKKGLQFFIQAGPQFGYLLGESTDSNFAFEQRNMDDRANKVYAQDSMSVENKFDYGIAAGAGIEYTAPKIGHFLLEGRYYYGLGNIYGDSKRDYFSKSNNGSIVIKLTYLRDI